MLSKKYPNRSLIDVALGNEHADMVIRDGVLVDVYTGRMVPKQSLSIKDEWIVYVGPDAAHTIGEQTEVVEAHGRILSPGFIDAHTHIWYHWDVAEFLKYAIPSGATTIVTEVESFVHANGREGFTIALHQSRDRPVKIYNLIPPMITLSPAAEGLCLTREDVREFLEDEGVIGLGESYWQGVVIPPNEYILDLIGETLGAGKSVQGHAAGASDRRLSAYSAIGVLSCHESISTQDVVSRLQLGYYVMIREGYIRRDLEIIMPLVDRIDTRRLVLVTDGTYPTLLSDRGYLVDVVQKAVDLGLEPYRAIQMVSINPAEHFGIDHFVGGLAPGRLADVLIIPEPGKMKPDLVISGGRIVAGNGEVTVPLERRPYPKGFLETVRVNPIHASELYVPKNGKRHLRVIDIQEGGLVTREAKIEIDRSVRELSSDIGEDLLKAVFIERASGTGERFVGFVRGWGQKKGAVATSLCWDVSGIIAIGENDRDIATAVNRVIELQGGTVLVADGGVAVEIPSPVAGYVSLMELEEIAKEMTRFQEVLVDVGSRLRLAHLTLCVLASAAIPFIRLTEKGYFRFRENDIVGLGE